MQSTLTVEALYTPEHTLAAPLLRSVVYPWEALAGIRECIRALGAALSPEEYDSPRPGVWIHKTAHVFDSAYRSAITSFLKNPHSISCAPKVRFV